MVTFKSINELVSKCSQGKCYMDRNHRHSCDMYFFDLDLWWIHLIALCKWLYSTTHVGTMGWIPDSPETPCIHPAQKQGTESMPGLLWLILTSDLLMRSTCNFVLRICPMQFTFKWSPLLTCKLTLIPNISLFFSNILSNICSLKYFSEATKVVHQHSVAACHSSLILMITHRCFRPCMAAGNVSFAGTWLLSLKSNLAQPRTFVPFKWSVWSWTGINI